MAEFGAKERMVASLLSSFPTVKRAVKWLYVKLNAVVYKKAMLKRYATTGFLKLIMLWQMAGKHFWVL